MARLYNHNHLYLQIMRRAVARLYYGDVSMWQCDNVAMWRCAIRKGKETHHDAQNTKGLILANGVCIFAP